MDEKAGSEYGTRWVRQTLIPLGGGWGIVVGIVSDQNGNLKARISKGKLQSGVTADGSCQVSQANHLNLKPREWEQVKAEVDKVMAVLAAGGHDA